MAVSREDLRRYLDGHRRADKRRRDETLRRLVELTVDGARAEYDSLCRVWENRPDVPARFERAGAERHPR